MIKQTSKEPTFTLLSDPFPSSDLSFQFNFDDVTSIQNDTVELQLTTGFWQQIKEKWLDYKKEFSLVALTYVLIFSFMGMLSMNLFQEKTNLNRTDLNLSFAPLHVLSSLYNQYQSDNKVDIIPTLQSSLVVIAPSEAPKTEVLVPVNPDEEMEATEEIENTIVESTDERVAAAAAIAPTKDISSENTYNPYSYDRNTGVKIMSEDYFATTKNAAAEGKYTLLKFGAKWCMPCRIMEETVFQDEQVNGYLDQHFQTLKVDIDEFDGINLKQHFNIERIPAFVVLDARGTVVGRYSKSMSIEKTLSMLEQYR